MLSAVAARKAAKAAAEASSASSSKPPSPPPPRSDASSPAIPKDPKRRPRVSANGGSSLPKTKKAKVAHTPAKANPSVRYFDARDPSHSRNGGDEATMISANSDSSSSSVDDLEIALDDSQQTELLSFSANKSKRAWSPSRPMADSSDEEEPGPSRVGDLKNAAPLAHQTPLKAEPTTLSTFCPVLDRNLYLLSESESAPNEKGAILVLHPNESVTLLGTYTICVLQGYISLLGVTLSPSDTKHRVFAPRSSPLPVLSWVAAGGLPDTCTFPVPPVVRQRSECTAILIRYLDTGVEGLGRICRVFDNVFKPPRNPNVFQNLELPELNLITHSTKDIHPFTLPHSWETALSSIDGTQVSDIATAPICLVRGPKKTGKSTFARTLVNRLLDRYRRVAFLECDLGQSEFTPGGMVALNVVENYVFGPPFTHPSLPYRAHYIGSTSPRSSPSYYLSSIQALVETYRLDVQFTTLIDDPSPGDDRIHDTIPLVVNTMGWTKGLGADLNLRIEEFVEPSHIFEIEGPEERGWPAPLQSQHTPQNPTLVPFTQAKARTHVKLEAISSESTNTYHTAIDHRNLNVLSYFHAIFPELSESSSSSSQLKQITASGWDTSLPLCARYPYEVDCSQAFDQVFLTGPGYEDVVPSELTRVLNGAIVGLVSCDSRISDISTQTPTPWPNGCPFPYTPSQPPPDPASSTCHGLALVRGIPLSSVPPHMHILTPLSPQLLSDARILVKGELELPIWGMLDFRESEEGGVTGVERGHVPYLQWGKGEGVGSEKRRVRRNLMRKGQM